MRITAREAVGESDFFEKAERKFAELTQDLRGRQTQAMDFSELEKRIEKEGRELLRLMLEAHLNARGMGDIGPSIEGADNVLRTHRRIGGRQIRSIFGTIEFERLTYGGRGEESLFPKDAHLNLPAEQMHSHEFQRRVALEVIKGSYGQAAESISEATGTPVFKQQVEFITVQAGADFDAFYEQNLSPEKIEEAMKAPLLILTTDAKGIIMRKGDLRPATRKKAEEQRHKLDKRLSPGEKKHSKRMAQVASVYNIEPQIRTAQDFRRELSNLRDVDEEPRPKPLAKRVWASVEKEPERVVQEMFEEAVRRDEKKKKTWVALVDGCPRQIARIETQAKVQGVDVTIVCDIIHVLEYVWKAAWAFFSKGDLKAQEWVTERFIAILEGKSSLVAAGIRRSATNQKFCKAKREAIDECATYLLNKAPYLKYDQYLKLGFPIATGVIEGACRHLIKDRMDITGARWSLHGAEAVLRLRSIKSSGDFTDYWAFHENQEFIRNHKSKYRKPSVINKLHLKTV